MANRQSERANRGGTGTEDLVKRVRRQLGFQRLGPNIKLRITDVLGRLLRAGRFQVSDRDGRVWLNAPT